MFTLIENGEILAPAPSGRASVLLAGGRIARIGDVDRRALDALGVSYETVNASGCFVVPGLIDPHEHLTGGSGEKGWASQTPEIGLREIVLGGITTVVGCLGTDTVTRTMPALLARARALSEEGITTFVWSGGYDVPPVTLTGSVKRDMLFIPEVIGAGEIAIADHRSSAPQACELARLVKESHVAGTLTGKAGVTHFHTGEEPRGLADVRLLLDEHAIGPEWVYPTHVERTDKLLGEAAELSRRGVTVDVDTIECDLEKNIRVFTEAGGDLEKLTASSDAGSSSPTTLLEQVRSCVMDHSIPLQRVLPLVTSNTARVLRLARKGRIKEGADADITVLRREGLEVVEVIAGGRRLIVNGAVAFREAAMKGSNRHVEMHGYD